eukprot:CAMPEP_0173386236 /NCGR_PEP_ID=MMETSP1356-20130122/8822_1 /TAXON_ID=77927 ORGANISM="Hemiselmis virescens, Strain PCC157" /NCGR_SAMPLE_ID=MMETSP1356 /ASSEMBLY_ACC=CAM_ASM_000847 /LENGTH=131 /DNA_ID=CAMNT_0014342391 /DNA_START=52 /DNA_END=447 /DNA_ORIENTATION=-
MLAKATILAMIGSAAAFNAPMMGLNVDRRAAVAGAAVMPLVGAASSAKAIESGNIYAPIVEIFDNRGCDASFKIGYDGAPANDMEDEQCVKVSMVPIKVSQATGAKKIQEVSGFKASGIDVPQISGVKKLY